MMDLYILIGQRHERYDGEYAPEALAVIDGHGDDENPDYMMGELKKQTDSGEFAALKVFHARVPDNTIHKALFPSAEESDIEIVE